MKQAKQPSFQFYPGDWRKDPGVQALGYFERGVWFEILCLMFESQERGKLMLNGKAMPEAALARLLGLDNQVLTTALTAILEYGVASREEVSGALICRRMIRDEELRQIRKQCGSLGGNPNLLNQKSKQKETTKDKQNETSLFNQKSTPSSSSSSSDNSPIVPKGTVAPHFLRARALFRIPPSRPADRAELTAQKKNGGAVAATTEAEWLLLEWWFSQPAKDKGDVAEFRRKGLPSLLNNWNEEIVKAGRAAADLNLHFGKKRGPEIPDAWKELLGEASPESHIPATFGELPKSTQEWVWQLAAEKKKKGPPPEEPPPVAA